MRGCVSVSPSLGGCGKQRSSSPDHWEVCFQHILSHAFPGKGHFPSDSSSPVEEQQAVLSQAGEPGRLVASAVGAVAGEMANVAQVTSPP